MSQLMKHVEYLSKEIGPRPAGTEEEQQASLYITEQFQKESGFAATIEDFASSSNVEAALAVLAAVAVLATVFAIVFPVLTVPAFVLATAAAVVYSLELFDRPTVSRLLSRGASQNVVAKYQPGSPAQEAASGRRSGRRKIVLVAHYDTGRVVPPLVSRVESSGLPIPLVCVIGVIAAAFFLLLRIFVAPGGGMGLLVLNVLSVIAALVCILPIGKALLVRSSPYNEGATNNASGVAVLLETARLIARGSVSEADLLDMADDVVIHGEAAAREAGLVPEGVEFEYQAEQIAPPSELGDYTEEERLISAKAAIAALTGQPVERRVYGSVAENLVNSRASELPDGDAGFVAPAASPDSAGAAAAELVQKALAGEAQVASGSPEPEPAASADGFENAPSWFVAAQQNAKKSERFNADEAPEVKRSRYNEAIEHAEQERKEAEAQQRAAAQSAREEEARAALQASAAADQPSVSEKDSRHAEPDKTPDPSRASADDPQYAELDKTPDLSRVSEEDPQRVGASFRSPRREAPHAAIGDPAATFSDSATPGDPAATPALNLPALDPAPNATTAMPAHIPAAEIRAEAGIPDPAAPSHRISSLPSIESATGASATGATASDGPAPTKSPSRSGILRNLRASVPSLSGAISAVKSDDPQGSPQPARAARHEVASIPDVVPAASQDPAPATAALTSAPTSVEVPRSRSGNLLNRLRHADADDDLSDTPQQWLNVDDDFEARSVGRARGSWESFRDDQYDDDDFGDFGSGDSPRRWEGGAYSGRMQMGHANTRSGAEFDSMPLPEIALADEPAPVSAEDAALSGEIEQIYHFRNPQFSTEIWFVAMGADGDSHDGARAFLEAHRDELRGSMIIEIESLGAGTLATASEEGRVRKVQASSRVKRFTRSATAATGIAPDTTSLVGSDSAASTIQKGGFQAMHLFGAEDGRPALKGSADDVLENVDEMLLEEHMNFVFELLKQ